MSASEGKKSFTICHFNDAYHIDQESKSEPVGGAARFLTAVEQIREEEKARGGDVRVTCGGDVFSPSLMSIAFSGNQMIPILNALKVDVAICGNHDFDFGEEKLDSLLKKTECDWVMTNAIDERTQHPLANSDLYIVRTWGGIRVGIIGLIEPGWMETLSCDTENFAYSDYVKLGSLYAKKLREEEGVEIVIALTHMRLPEDLRLAKESEGIDLILGGHDHFYHHSKEVNFKGEDVVVVKAGMDFRYLSKVGVSLGGSGKLSIVHKQIPVDSSIPASPEIETVVHSFKSKLEGKLSKQIGTATTVLDSRASFVRTTETGVGNWVSDVMRMEFGADCSIVNSGTIRSNSIYEPGPVTMKSLLLMFPFEDIIVVATVTGDDIWKALENGVSKWPATEGRFPQVSGIRFTFDGSLPAGERIKEVEVAGEPLSRTREYSLATKPYMLSGKDGYTSLADKPLTVDLDNGQLLSLLLRNHFRKLQFQNAVRWALRSTVEVVADKMAGLLKQKLSEGEKGDSEEEKKLLKQEKKKQTLPIISPSLDGRIVELSGTNPYLVKDK